MKPEIHPEYRYVVFRDKSADYSFLTRSTMSSANEMIWSDEKTYPVVDVDVSSRSHPFYTGRTRILDAAGQVEKFQRRYGRNPQSEQ